jgi:hypothetical protein
MLSSTTPTPLLIAMLTSLIALLSCANRPPEYVDRYGVSRRYSRIAETTVSGSELELAMAYPGIINTHDVHIHFVIKRREFIVTTKRFLYRYRIDGELLDILESESQFRRGEFNIWTEGVHFFKSDYIDWELSGDKSAKPYATIYSHSDLDDAALKLLIERAERVEYGDNHKDGVTSLFLLNESRWSRVDSQRLYHLRSKEPFYEEPPNIDDQNDTNDSIASWVTDRIRMQSPVVVPLKPDGRWDINSSQSPLQVIDFRKLGKSRKPFFDLNSHGWEGDFGHGYFQLQQQGDELRFEIETARTTSERYSPDMEVIHARDIDPEHNSAVFIRLHSRPHSYRPADELALYVLRPINREPAEAMVDAHKTRILGIELGQWHPRLGQWRQIHFFNGQREMIKQDEQDLANDVLPKTRAMPSMLVLLWEFGDAQKRMMLRINDSVVKQDHGPSVFIAFTFDRAELSKAFSELGDALPISLRLDAEPVEKGVVVTASVGNASQRIVLKRSRVIDLFHY